MFHVKQSALQSAPEVGLDWLCMTLPQEDVHHTEWAASSYDWVAQGLVLGNEIKPWGASGYQGFSTKGRMTGAREDGTMTRGTGAQAPACWEALYRPYVQVTRIDFQVTVFVGNDHANALIRQHYENVDQAIYQKVISPRTCDFHENNGGGTTAYIGSRQSLFYGRIYNKWEESHDRRYYGCIRYEIEYKDWQARQVARQFYRTKREDRAALISNTVVRSFWDRAVKIPGIWADGARAILVAPTEPSDVQRKLKWLERQVAPTVATLIDRGLMFEVLEALGLPGEDPEGTSQGLTGPPEQ